MPLPLCQGHLDKACGFYAILNAISEVNGMSIERSIKLFEDYAKRQPDIVGKALRSGMFFVDLKLVLPELVEMLTPEEKVAFSFPFAHKKFGDINSYARQLGGLINDTAHCAVVGFGLPWMHWTVVTNVTKSALTLRDSTNHKRRLKKTLMVCNETDEYSKRTVVHARQTILFSPIS